MSGETGHGAMRSLAHPGTPAARRWQASAAAGRHVEVVLRGGLSVNEAVARALAEAGFDGGFVRLDGATLWPLRYVIPAASDGHHAAWYSDAFAPRGVVRIEEAGAIAGWRDGERFIHCHGIWTLADGSRRMGHLLPHDSILEQDVSVETLGVTGATFAASEDDETGFKLFAPQATTGSPCEGRRTLVCTVRPNLDISSAIEAICAERGISHAAVLGIGSLIGADFEDGSQFSSYANEVVIQEGWVRPGPDGPRCRLDIALVGMDGAIAGGTLMRGRNPVCVTFELLIEDLDNGD